MSSQATFVRNANDLRPTVSSAVAALAVQKLANGRAAILNNSIQGVAAGDQGRFRDDGQWTVPKTSGIALLNGGPVWWNFTNQLAHYARQNSGDFLLGSAIGDAKTTDSTCVVDLNVEARYVGDIARDPFTSALIGTTEQLNRRGGSHDLVIVNTNEAQKIDGLADDGFVIPGGGPGPIVEIQVNVIDGGASSHVLAYAGLANATHATALTSVAQYLLLALASNATAIKFQSADGTNTTVLTDSTKTYTASTRFEIWFDCRNPAAVGIYVNGVPVLTSVVFNIAAAGSAVWKPIFWVAKTASTDTFEMKVDRLRARIMDQP